MTGMNIAVISVHTSPLARPGGAKAGGLNVYVLELARQLAASGNSVDIYSRATSPNYDDVVEIAPGLRAIHLPAGPLETLSPEALFEHLEAFEAAVLEFN